MSDLRIPSSLQVVHRPITLANPTRQLNAGVTIEEPPRIRQTEAERGNTYRRPGGDPTWQLALEVIRLPELPVTQTAAEARVSEDSVIGARAHPAQKPVWIAVNDRGDQCGHHHQYFTSAVACCRRMERRYRRTYAGRLGYAKRQDWLAERAHVEAAPALVSATTRAKLTRYAVEHAGAQLRTAGVIDNARKISPQILLARYLEHAERQAAERCCTRPGCHNPAPRHSNDHTNRCARAARQTAHRKHKRIAV